MKTTAGLVLAMGVSALVYGQRLEFEVASIKPSGSPAPGQLNVGVHIDGAQVRCTYLTMKDYIGMAYNLRHHQISGPDWLGSERFDIAAKLPNGAKSEQVAQMMQALLADRFQMKSHRDSKEFPVYGLTVARGGLKLKESPPDPEAESGDAAKAAVNVTATGGRGGVAVNLGKGSSFNIGSNRLDGKKLTMVQLAEMLGRFVDRPVVDMTELKGAYDMTLEFSPEDFRAMMVRSAIAAGVSLPPEALRALEGASGDSLATAMQTAGLRLESRRAPIEVLVVDQLLKTPTEN